MFCLVGCLQCRRCILQTPIDSKRSTHHRDAPQHSMLVTAWMNYKYTASYFQVSLSSNGITSRAVAPPAVTGDANRLYYSQTRSRQEAGLFDSRVREEAKYDEKNR